MRRVLSATLCVILIFSLSACIGKRTFVLEEFQRDVSFEVGGITVKGSLQYKKENEISFTVKEPENISGIVFTYDEVSAEGVKADYGKTGDRSPVKLLISAVSDIAASDISLPFKGEYTHSGGNSSWEYKAKIDCEKAVITSIETEKYTYKFE